MKDHGYTIVLNGSILEHPSLVELRMDATPEQWEIIVGQISNFYQQMYAAYLVNSTILEKNDIRIMKSLRRTLAVIKNLDFTNYTKYNNDEIVANYKQAAQDEIKNLSAISVALNNSNVDSDIKVNPRTIKTSSL